MDRSSTLSKRETEGGDTGGSLTFNPSHGSTVYDLESRHTATTKDFEMGKVGDGPRVETITSVERQRSRVITAERAEHISNLIVKAMAPNASQELTGKWAYGFICWVLLWNMLLVGFFLYYFLSLTCSLSSTAISVNLPSSVFVEAFNNPSIGTFICSSYTTQVFGTSFTYSFDDDYNRTNAYYFHDDSASLILRYCTLPGLTCDDYHTTEYKCKQANNINVGTNLKKGFCSAQASPYDCQQLRLYDIAFESVASVTYVQCTPPSTAVVNAIQYTVYLQLLIYIIYMSIWIVNNRGWLALCQKKTWVGLLLDDSEAEMVEAVKGHQHENA